MIRTMYGYSVELPFDFDTALRRTRQCLQEQEFGILTDIDVGETLKNSLDVDIGKYRILGVYVPPLAYRALGADKYIGLLLPCNVIIYESGDNTVVAAVDAEALLSMVDNPKVEHIAREVGNRLKAALSLVSEEVHERR